MPVKSILVDESTHIRLTSYQQKGETKEQMINRLLDEVEKEGTGMRTEQEIRAKLEELRSDTRENAGRDNRKIYQLALCWVLKEYKEL